MIFDYPDSVKRQRRRRRRKQNRERFRQPRVGGSFQPLQTNSYTNTELYQLPAEQKKKQQFLT